MVTSQSWSQMLALPPTDCPPFLLLERELLVAGSQPVVLGVPQAVGDFSEARVHCRQGKAEFPVARPVSSLAFRASPGPAWALVEPPALPAQASEAVHKLFPSPTLYPWLR